LFAKYRPDQLLEYEADTERGEQRLKGSAVQETDDGPLENHAGRPATMNAEGMASGIDQPM